MIQFISYYYINLWRSKENNIPLGLMILGRIGYYAYRFFPFDLFSYFISIFLIQWFCFGLTSELLEKSGFSFNGMFFPSIGLLISLFIFDMIHFKKSFYYNFRYSSLIEISNTELSKYKVANEIIGGKIISIILFIIFYSYYFDLIFKDLLVVVFIYFSYNSLVILLGSVTKKRDDIFYIIFIIFVVGMGVISSDYNSSFDSTFADNEKYFFDFFERNSYILFSISILCLILSYVYSLKELDNNDNIQTS